MIGEENELRYKVEEIPCAGGRTMLFGVAIGVIDAHPNPSTHPNRPCLGSVARNK